jgi:hypothetical protein
MMKVLKLNASLDFNNEKLSENPLSTKKNETQSEPLNIDRKIIFELTISDSVKLKLKFKKIGSIK